MEEATRKRRLTLVRHAHAGSSRGVGRDHERALDERGRREAELMGRRWANRYDPPARMLVSTAARARETARILASQLRVPAHHLEFRDEMYGAGIDRLLSVLEEVDSETTHLALVCHNPGVSDFASWLCHDFDEGMPTCAVVAIDVEAEGWWELSSGCGRMLDFDYPARSGEST